MLTTIFFSYITISAAISLSVVMIAGRASRMEEQMEALMVARHS